MVISSQASSGLRAAHSPLQTEEAEALTTAKPHRDSVAQCDCVAPLHSETAAHAGFSGVSFRHDRLACTDSKQLTNNSTHTQTNGTSKNPLSD
ncbi:unnamed protein product [Protopolystoma xenopodis]|uniref:Uncharacterized protein n=1 Tax=Protopolystoma xenopodis TaxID=117903 RepID=A0A448X7Y4_9PLAT|nr:unnamed protein product [Protopolystoma xenopodis]